MGKTLTTATTTTRSTLSLTKQRIATSRVPYYCCYSAARSLATTRDHERDHRRLLKKFKPRKRIFSGIQPTGIPHLGNYLGALQTWKKLQDDATDLKNPKNYQLLFAIADLHALTANQNRQRFLQQRKESYASLLAIGLDPKHSLLFMQSSIAAHTQLMWVLSTIASTGYLSRMTQWKSKLGLSENATLNDKEATEKLKLGLFSYPVLQAADILLYRPDFVPVGEDQAQHIEFTRTLARSFFAHYGSLEEEKNKRFFTEPNLMLSPAKRIMSLKEPHKKMSKSHTDPASRILITDSREEINQKLRSALTDSIQGISYDPKTRPGVSNLIEILKHVSSRSSSSKASSSSLSSCEEIAAENAEISMRAFKEHIADAIWKELEGIRDRFHVIMDPKNHTMADALESGRSVANSIAVGNIRKVYRILGLEDDAMDGHRGDISASTFRDEKDSKKRVQEEQERLEQSQVDGEPDVLPQQDQGVDRPLAS